MARKPRALSTHHAPKKRKPHIPPDAWKGAFLQELRNCGNVRMACRKAHVERTTVYRARQEDDEFAAAWKDALDDAIDSLEAEAWRRARDGARKLVTYKGEPVKVGRKFLYDIEYSDTLLVLLLKAHRGDKFRERVENWNVDVSQLTDEQIVRLANGEDPRLVLAGEGKDRAGAPPARPLPDA